MTITENRAGVDTAPADPTNTTTAPPTEKTKTKTKSAPGQAQPRQQVRKLLGPQARPHVAMACLMGAAGAAQIASEVSGKPGVVAVSTAIVLFVGAVLLAFVCRTRLANAAQTFGRGWVSMVGLSIIGWLTTVAGTGISWESTAALAVGGTALGLRWWQHHRIPNTPPVAAPPASVVIGSDRPSLSQVQQWWKTSIAANGGRLHGAELIDPIETFVSDEYTVQLVPGRQTATDVIRAIPHIASGLRREPTDIVIERVVGDASQVKMTVLKDSKLVGGIMYTEPVDADNDDHIALGPWADGSGYASYRLYSKNSMWGGVVIGGIGSGKSEMLNLIGVQAARRGDTIVCFADGQDGASAPEMADKAHWFTGKDQTKLMLKGLATIVDWRSRQNQRRRWKGFKPRWAQKRPGILAIIDECHLIFEDQENQALAEHIGRVGRKVGVALLVGSQYAGIKTFGNSMPLRSALMAGNAIVLKTASSSEKGFFPRLEADPLDLPPLPGYGYLVDLVGNGKIASFRGMYFAENHEDWEPGDPVADYSVTWWWDQCPEVAMDHLSITVADQVLDGGYSNRKAIAEAELDKWAAEIDALEAGEDIDITNVAAIKHRPAAAIGSGLRIRKAPRLTDYLTGRHRPTDNRPGTNHLGRRITVPTIPDGLTDGETRVYKALQAGPRKPAELVTPAKLSASGVHKAIKRLIELGHVHQPTKFGPYELTTPETTVHQAA